MAAKSAKKKRGNKRVGNTQTRSRSTRSSSVRTQERVLVRSHLVREARGLLLLGLAAVSLLALVSEGEGANWVGPAGSLLAHYSVLVFGLVAFAIPLGVGVLALPAVRGEEHRLPRLGIWAWGLLLVLAACTLLTAALEQVRVNGELVFGGGELGHWTAAAVSSWLGALGSRVVAGVVALVALVMVTEQSVVALVGRVAQMVKPVFPRSLEAVRSLGGRFRQFVLAIPPLALEWWQGFREGLRGEGGEDDAVLILSDEYMEAAPSQEVAAVVPAPMPSPEEEGPVAVTDSLVPLQGPVLEPALDETEPPDPVISGLGGDSLPHSTTSVPIEPLELEEGDSTKVGEEPEELSLLVSPDGRQEHDAGEASVGEATEGEILDESLLVSERVVEDVAATRAVQAAGPFVLPGMDLLNEPESTVSKVDREQLLKQANSLVHALDSYKVKGKVVGIHPGPVVTRFDFEPARGVKVSKIMNLEEDLSLALASEGAVRVSGHIPGLSAIGIEVPNVDRETVYLSEVVRSQAFDPQRFSLPAALGKNIEGRSVAADLVRTPHLLVAGATGQGKSVTVNSILISLLLSRTPEDMRLILIDPKMLEFQIYDSIPHLLVPVVTDPRKASLALRWAVAEMTRRYKILARCGVRNMAGFNARVDEFLCDEEDVDPDLVPTLASTAQALATAAPSDEVFQNGRIIAAEGEDLGPVERMPYIVIVIDELADLMMVAKKEVEESIVRLAQMARAAGIHMILATQRPSVDVITGLIKANMPSRIACKVTSMGDSRTILDSNGAEHLLGRGDMLFLAPGQSGLKRVHGCFVSDEEVTRVTDALRSQGSPEYMEEILEGGDDEDCGDVDFELDETMRRSIEIVVRTQRASASGLQTKLGIGYPKAARIVSQMEEMGLVGPANGSKARKVLIKPYELEDWLIGHS